MIQKCKILIKYSKGEEEFSLRKGASLQVLLAYKNSPVEFDCREADCGICIFKTLAGAENLSPPTYAEKDFLKAMGANEKERLACQCRILGDVELQVDDGI